jgi:hypothetical protein
MGMALAPRFVRYFTLRMSVRSLNHSAAASRNVPPPQALFHVLLRNPHAAVKHATLQSQVHVCRTVPQQYAAAVRRLFPPDFSPAAGAPLPPGGHQAQLAAVFKSYMSRRVADDEAAAAQEAEPQARSAEGEQLARATKAQSVAERPVGRLAAALPALCQAVERSADVMQVRVLSRFAVRGTLTPSGAGSGGRACWTEPPYSDIPYYAVDLYICSTPALGGPRGERSAGRRI